MIQAVSTDLWSNLDTALTEAQNKITFGDAAAPEQAPQSGVDQRVINAANYFLNTQNKDFISSYYNAARVYAWCMWAANKGVALFWGGWKKFSTAGEWFSFLREVGYTNNDRLLNTGVLWNGNHISFASERNSIKNQWLGDAYNSFVDTPSGFEWKSSATEMQYQVSILSQVNHQEMDYITNREVEIVNQIRFWFNIYNPDAQRGHLDRLNRTFASFTGPVEKRTISAAQRNELRYLAHKKIFEWDGAGKYTKIPESVKFRVLMALAENVLVNQGGGSTPNVHGAFDWAVKLFGPAGTFMGGLQRILIGRGDINIKLLKEEQRLFALGINTESANLGPARRSVVTGVIVLFFFIGMGIAATAVAQKMAETTWKPSAKQVRRLTEMQYENYFGYAVNGGCLLGYIGTIAKDRRVSAFCLRGLPYAFIVSDTLFFLKMVRLATTAKTKKEKVFAIFAAAFSGIAVLAGAGFNIAWESKWVRASKIANILERFGIKYWSGVNIMIATGMAAAENFFLEPGL